MDEPILVSEGITQWIEKAQFLQFCLQYRKLFFEKWQCPASKSTPATFILYKSLPFLTLLLRESRQQSSPSRVSGGVGQESAFI